MTEIHPANIPAQVFPGLTSSKTFGPPIKRPPKYPPISAHAIANTKKIKKFVPPISVGETSKLSKHEIDKFT